METQGKVKTFEELLAKLQGIVSQIDAEIAARKSGGKAGEGGAPAAGEGKSKK